MFVHFQGELVSGSGVFGDTERMVYKISIFSPQIDPSSNKERNV
jgi:hypothetical protein